MLECNLEEKEKQDFDYKKFVVDSTCMPQIAASLIAGFDPDKYIRKDNSDWRDVKILAKEIQEICDVLCNGSRLWWNYDNYNIFRHINFALNNRIIIAQGLMKEVHNYFLNCLDSDRERLIRNYPYIARELKLAIPIIETPEKTKQPQATFTETEKGKVLQILLGMAMHAYKYDPESTRNLATGENKGSISAGLQEVNLNVTNETIKKYLEEAAKLFPHAKPIK